MNITDKKKFLSKNDLDAILFKLKRYYNDVNKSKMEMETNIHNLNEFISEADKNISFFNQSFSNGVIKNNISTRSNLQMQIG